jgi:nitronate monooxygenase
MRFTELVGCSVPIQQAGLGTMSPPELVAAVSEAGGLGMLGTARGGGGSPAALHEQVHSLTARPFGVYFLMAPEYLETTEPCRFALAARAARLVDFCTAGENQRSLILSTHMELWSVGR